MAQATSQRADAMLTRLETDLEERNAFINATIANAQDANRELTDMEHENLSAAKKCIEEITRNIESIGETRASATRAFERLDAVDREFAEMRRNNGNGKGGAIEYRSAGSYVVDVLGAYQGSRDARERLEIFNRVAAHNITTDVPGLLPTPVVGDVINFIDAARPLVNALGVQELTTSPFRRPKATQQPAVGLQGDAGVAADEKEELDSQKMTISSTTINALTYGGYVNVSRQTIDWTSPNAFDLIVNALAQQYAITTEAAAADALQAVATTAVDYPLNPTAEELNASIWEAAAVVYAAAKG